MKVRGLWVAALLLAAVLLPWGCRFGPGSRAAAPERPKPVVQLAGQSYAYVVRDSSLLPTGVGAEGSPGDLLLENAFVRFVVASADHAGPAWLRGNLIDAAVQRGEDRMRLLVPLLGGSRPVRPTWETVTVANRGGPDEPGVVVSKGHLSDNASVKVETTYTLPPGARSLEITTKVLNETAGMLALFGCRDQLYHGRTARFAPSVGLFPAGKRGSSRWLAFFWQDRVWGIVAGPLGTMDGVHEVGVSELHYCTVDIPAGESRSYRRSLVAGVGGPEAVWLQAWPVPESTRSHLALTIRDRDTGEPVEGAQVHLEAADKRSPVVLVTDCLGKVALDLPGGKCKVRVRAAGRAPAGPHLLNCVAGSSHTLAIPISARAEAVVSVRARIGPYAAPTRARICSYLTRGFAGPVPAGPAFPTPSPAGVVLANGLTEVRLPLALTKGSLPVPCVVVASKGPLFDCAVVPAEGEAGRTIQLDLRLTRVVEPGGYVAVDFRQHTDGSPDCPLTLSERLLADECEGLDAAVVSDPLFRTALVGLPADAACALIPGFRFEGPGVGSFSFFPLDAPGPARSELSGIVEPGLSAAQVLRKARELFPEAVIQVDRPLDERKGYFALSGFNPPMGRHSLPGTGEDFDAIEILSGRDVRAARELLPYWFHLLNSGREVMVTGGSGSRGIVGEEAGVARTFVYCPSAGARPTRAAVADAIRGLRQTPNAFVTNGPFIEATLNGEPIGSSQTVADGKARMRLRVYAPLWVDVTRAVVYRNGQVAEELTIPAATRPLRCDRVLELDAAADCWFVVHVEGHKPMSPVYGGTDSPTPFAVTNPFWVDADGDGEVNVAR